MARSSFPVALPHRVLAALVLAAAVTIQASDTPRPDVVAIAVTFQTELGCSADWQPECERTRLPFDVEDDVWQAIFSIPAGSWEYKAALNVPANTGNVMPHNSFSNPKPTTIQALVNA
jgi:Pullulanase X25 domain